jgi:hypothetical protein
MTLMFALLKIIKLALFLVGVSVVWITMFHAIIHVGQHGVIGAARLAFRRAKAAITKLYHVIFWKKRVRKEIDTLTA